MASRLETRLKRLEAAIRPQVVGDRNVVTQLWRQSDSDPDLYRLESGGAWVTEAEMLAQLPGTPSRTIPRLVIVKGNWSQLVTLS